MTAGRGKELRGSHPGQDAGTHLLEAGRFPALAAFARGYLHEDLIAAYGSARAAATAFRADATPSERRELEREISALLEAVEGRSLRTLRRFMTKDLTSCWTPRSVEEVRALRDALQVDD